MALVIDTFEVPSLLISRKLFRSLKVMDIEEVSLETIEDVLTVEGIYSIHKECFSYDDIRWMKYYFNEVVEVFANVQYINKSKKVVKYYSIIRDLDGTAIDLVEIKENENEEIHDKTAFLPYIKAQGEEIVIFPDDED
ncbi:hypothetical protein EROM_040970 [Encephalitozoon romaleae SJ-2008]|uniref:Uncharacterized protein n=1 Tax=Encephalitozoon romaleae (strain SJ-2008) TaxID=1178016 RepID=I7AMD5_ENCRO|nr:hypothetical protein EROM_040970 [Encephalitozoon romaleae SJ-2008]AFN82864.1 hypothetical protein EROM_040970 [Encephalitozoon romaleae SJ-2008]